MLDRVLDRLTDNYRKDNQSIIHKLIQILVEEMELLQSTLHTIKEYRDINKASGQSLDRIGYNVQQLREDGDDEFYRLLIQTKIISNRSIGNIDTINQVCQVLLGDNFESVTETWNNPKYDNQPAGLVVTIKSSEGRLPFKAIERAIAGGVGVDWVLETVSPLDGGLYFGSTMQTGMVVAVYPKEVGNG